MPGVRWAGAGLVSSCRAYLVRTAGSRRADPAPRGGRTVEAPLRETAGVAAGLGLGARAFGVAVGTGDTAAAERTALLKNPPDILITTPESLFLLVTAERSRAMLHSARTVIVDEIHAV